jgi:hypothetical protein
VSGGPEDVPPPEIHRRAGQLVGKKLLKIPDHLLAQLAQARWCLFHDV